MGVDGPIVFPSESKLIRGGFPVRPRAELQVAGCAKRRKGSEMTETSPYPLRLLLSLKKAVGKQREEDGTSMNQFVAEKMLRRWPRFLPTGKRGPILRLSTKS